MNEGKGIYVGKNSALFGRIRPVYPLGFGTEETKAGLMSIKKLGDKNHNFGSTQPVFWGPNPKQPQATPSNPKQPQATPSNPKLGAGPGRAGPGRAGPGRAGFGTEETKELIRLRAQGRIRPSGTEETKAGGFALSQKHGDPINIYEKVSGEFSLIGSFVSRRKAAQFLEISAGTVTRYMQSGKLFKDKYKFSRR